MRRQTHCGRQWQLRLKVGTDGREASRVSRPQCGRGRAAVVGSAGSAVSRLVMPWRYGAPAGMSSLRGIQVQGERRAAGRLCGRTWSMPLGLAAAQLSDLFDL
jgi:hypothetical protein